MGNPKTVDKLSAEDNPKKCPDCGGKVEYQHGELVCTKCGLVIE